MCYDIDCDLEEQYEDRTSLEYDDEEDFDEDEEELDPEEALYEELNIEFEDDFDGTCPVCGAEMQDIDHSRHCGLRITRYACWECDNEANPDTDFWVYDDYDKVCSER